MKTMSLAGRLSKSFSLLAAVLIALCGASLYYSIIILKPIYEKDTIWIALVAGEILFISVIMMVITRRLCSKHLEKQLGELKTGAQRLAAGDFSGQLQVFGQDELGSFAAAMNNSNTYLVNLLRTVYTISGELVKATEQLNQLTGKGNNYTISLEKDTNNLESQLLPHQNELADIQNSLHNVLIQMNLLMETSEKHIQNTADMSQMVGKLEMGLSKTGKYLLDHSQPVAENCDSLAEAAEKAVAIEGNTEAVNAFVHKIKEILLGIALEAAEEGKPELAEKARTLNNISHDLMSGMGKTIEEITAFKKAADTSAKLLRESNVRLLKTGEKFHEMTVSFKGVKERMNSYLQESRELDDLIKSGVNDCEGIGNQLDTRLAATGNILEAMSGVKALVKLVGGRTNTIKTPVQQIKRATKKLQNLSLQFKT
ncbi:MAG TPA: methyl-accepting chemotaxis protein [Clostridia bacterium]|nr:methyl-accepting chemotaxis protein [Clostridia bacterium]